MLWAQKIGTITTLYHTLVSTFNLSFIGERRDNISLSLYAQYRHQFQGEEDVIPGN